MIKALKNLKLASFVGAVYAQGLNIGQSAANLGVPYATANSANSANYRQGFANILSTVVSLAMAVAAIVLFFMLIWGSLDWIMSGGDKGRLENARNKITQSLLGMLVLVAAIALFIFVQYILGICILQFGSITCR